MQVPVECRMCSARQSVALRLTDRLACGSCGHQAPAGDLGKRNAVVRAYVMHRILSGVGLLCLLGALALGFWRVFVTEAVSAGGGAFLEWGALGLFLGAVGLTVYAELKQRVYYF